MTSAYFSQVCYFAVNDHGEKYMGDLKGFLAFKMLFSRQAS